MKPPITTYGPQWHAARPFYIGASEIAAICGLSPYQTVEDVAESKHKEQTPLDDSPNTPLWWGHKDEPAIVEAALHILRPGSKPWEARTRLTWLDDEHRIMASPDAVLVREPRERDSITAGPTETVEAKSVDRAAATWRNGPPAYVELQGHAQMALLGPQCERLHIAARISGRPVKTWTVERNTLLAVATKEIAKKWWDEYSSMGAGQWSIYAARTLADAGFSHAESISRNNKIAVIDGRDWGLIQQWREARQKAREWQECKTQLDAEVKELMGEADTLKAPNGQGVAYRSWVKRTSLDTKTLCAEHPDLEAKYTYAATHERLTEIKNRS